MLSSTRMPIRMAHAYPRQSQPLRKPILTTYAFVLTDSEMEFLKTHFKDYVLHLGNWVNQQIAKNKVTEYGVFKMLPFPELLIEDAILFRTEKEKKSRQGGEAVTDKEILENAKIELYLKWYQIIHKITLRLS